MEKVQVELKNHSKLYIDCDKSIAWELREFFSFFVPGYKFMPAYRNKVWDGKIKIYDYNTSTLPVGLYKHFQKFCEERNYTVEENTSKFGIPFDKYDISKQEVLDFITNLKLSSRGKKIEVYDYQFKAIYESIRDRRLLLLSPTGSGKSLIIYCLLRWWAAHRHDKLIVIVPTTSLVEQMYKDFDDYSTLDNSWDVSEWCHRIYSGKEKVNVYNRIFISTWQSIYKLPRTWFEQFGTVIGDEAHLFTANSLTKSMDKAIYAENRIGTTGTLDGTKTNELVLQGVFGPVRRVTKTKKLQDEGKLAKIDEISMIRLIYSDAVRRDFGKQTYQSEIEWLIHNEKRNKYISNLTKSLKGNTLVVFQRTEKHGKVLYQMLKDSVSEDRKVFYVDGGVITDDREAIRTIVENEENAIIVASLGTFSTGINIKNLHNIVFASPTKSLIKVLQSIGRGLRLADNGQSTSIFDFCDDLTWGKRRKNYSFQHSEIRMGIYKDEEFNVKTYKVNI